MIFLLTNMEEMDDIVKQFELEQWRRPRPPTQKELDKLRRNGAATGKPDLLDWFKTLCFKDASIHPELRKISRGCSLRVKSYDMYEVNGYRFRTNKYEKSRGDLSTTNTGVLALGVDDATNRELEYYGFIKDIIELKFDGDDELAVVMFDCHWFHPTRGIRHLDRFGLVEVAPESSNPANEPFVIANQVSQVYFVPYACTSSNLNAWRVAYKVPPLGSQHIPSIDDYTEAPSASGDVFQENIDNADGFVAHLGADLDNMTVSGSDEVVDPSELSDITTRRSISGTRTGRHVVAEEEECPEEIKEHIEEDVDDF